MRFLLLFLIVVLTMVAAIPESPVIPVEGAGPGDWNPQSFWQGEWGNSGVHKGIDIFAARGTPVESAAAGIVVYTGELPLGGRVVAILTPKWRVHYYAHLDSIQTSAGRPVGKFTPIGQVGDSGNAKGKPPHLHYAIVTLVPYPWGADGSEQGWQKMFFLDPGRLLKEG